MLCVYIIIVSSLLFNIYNYELCALGALEHWPGSSEEEEGKYNTGLVNPKSTAHPLAAVSHSKSTALHCRVEAGGEH